MAFSRVCGKLEKILPEETAKENICLLNAVWDIFEAGDLLRDAFCSFSDDYGYIFSKLDIPILRKLEYHFDNDEFIRIFDDTYDDKEIVIENDNAKIIHDICIKGIQYTKDLTELIIDFINDVDKIEDCSLFDNYCLQFLLPGGTVENHINNVDKHDLALMMTCLLLYVTYNVSYINVPNIRSKYVCEITY